MTKVSIGDTYNCMEVVELKGINCVVKCKCGLTKEVLKTNLTTGRTKSLGCMKKKYLLEIEVKPLSLGDKLIDRFNSAAFELGFPQVDVLPPENPLEIPHWILLNLFYLKPYQLRAILKRETLGKIFPGYTDLINRLNNSLPDTSNDVLLDKFYLIRGRVINKLLTEVK